MKMSALFKKTLLLMVLLFGVIAVITSFYSGYNLDRALSGEYRSKGLAIAKSIADSSVEVLLNRDASMAQSMIDQFLEIEGVKYIFIIDGAGEIISHTFVPKAPAEVMSVRNPDAALSLRELEIPGLGRVLDVSSPILAGAAGTVHVGMDLGLIRAAIIQAVVRQHLIMAGLFVFSIIFAYAFMKRISLPLRELSEYADKIAHRDFEAYIAVRSHDEIGLLARTMQNMARDLKQSYEETERAYIELKQLDDMKSTFLSTVSHELRTPLTSIRGFANIIKNKFESLLAPQITSDEPKVRKGIAQVKENLGIIVAESERLTRLVDDVLDISKMEAGRIEWKYAPVSLTELIERCLAEKAGELGGAGLKLVKELEEGLPPVYVDQDKLCQVITNLISNAVKFSVAGTITCKAVRSGETILVSVADQGRGISEEDLPRIFDKFKQVGDTLTDKPKGTGLGLSLSQHIVEHHGGRIWAQSEPGKGSTFFFTIPVLTDNDMRRASENVEKMGHLRDLVISGARTMLDSVYATVEKIHANIEAEKVSIFEGRMRELKNITLVAEAYVRSIMHQVADGNLQERQAKEEVLSTLKKLKYGNNDYLYVCSLDSRLISHPDPECDGADFSQVRDNHGNLVVPPLVEVAADRGEGYSSYWWKRLDGNEPIEKLAFGRYIPEWQWVLATGVYIDDIQQEALKRKEHEIDDLRKMLRDLRIAKTGYLFVFDSKFNMIIHPNRNIEGTNTASLLNPVNYEYLFEELIKAATMEDNKHFYKWDRPEDPGNYIYDKVAWVRYFEGFDWYIAASVYVDELK